MRGSDTCYILYTSGSMVIKKSTCVRCGARATRLCTLVARRVHRRTAQGTAPDIAGASGTPTLAAAMPVPTSTTTLRTVERHVPSPSGRHGHHSVPDIWNAYGPTECSVDVSLYRYTGNPRCIGTPFSTVRCYVVDPHDPGKLLVAGPQVARGYLGRVKERLPRRLYATRSRP